MVAVITKMVKNVTTPTAGDSNAVKESFLLLDLLEEVNNVSTALGDFICTTMGRMLMMLGLNIWRS